MTADEFSNLVKRVQSLGNMTLPELRRWHPDCINESDWRTIRDNRGECIAAIIMEEFNHTVSN